MSDERVLAEWESLVCPKCRHGSIYGSDSSNYCAADRCLYGRGPYTEEHLHRTCGNCGYKWDSKCAPPQGSSFKWEVGLPPELPDLDALLREVRRTSDDVYNAHRLTVVGIMNGSVSESTRKVVD